MGVFSRYYHLFNQNLLASVGVHGQRTLGVTLTYVAITSSGINCVLKSLKGR